MWGVVERTSVVPTFRRLRQENGEFQAELHSLSSHKQNRAQNETKLRPRKTKKLDLIWDSHSLPLGQTFPAAGSLSRSMPACKNKMILRNKVLCLTLTLERTCLTPPHVPVWYSFRSHFFFKGFMLPLLLKNLNFISSLRVPYNVFWLFSSPTNSSQIHPTSLPTEFCVLKNTLQDQFVLAKYSWMRGLPLEYDHLTRNYAFKELSVVFSQKLTFCQ